MEGLREQDVVGGRIRFLLIGKSVMLVSYSRILSIILILIDFSDFMTVRRIPLQKHRYVSSIDDEEMDVDVDADADAGDESRPEDPEAPLFLEKIRAKLLTDRALHDQVSVCFCFSFNSNTPPSSSTNGVIGLFV